MSRERGTISGTDKREVVALVLTATGAGSVTAGAFVASTVAGLVVLGAWLVAFGLLLGVRRDDDG